MNDLSIQPIFSHEAEEEPLTVGSCSVSTRRTQNSAKNKGDTTAIVVARSNSRLRIAGRLHTARGIADVGISIRSRFGLAWILELGMARRAIGREAEWRPSKLPFRHAGVQER